MMFDYNEAIAVGNRWAEVHGQEGLPKNHAVSFATVCSFLDDNPDSLSLRGSNKPSIATTQGIERLAEKYYGAYTRLDVPGDPQTIPDEMVSIIMQSVYKYTPKECERIKREHQHSMIAENYVGIMLERYLNSVLAPEGWCWCCGEFVKAIDFVKKNDDGTWLSLQIKNRDNSENSSSSAIRNGTQIEKWFRTYSRTGKKNWDNLPDAMAGKGLSEEGFLAFVQKYYSGVEEVSL